MDPYLSRAPTGNGNALMHTLYTLYMHTMYIIIYIPYIVLVCVIALHQVSFWCVHRDSIHMPLCTSWVCVLMQIKYSCILHLELYLYVCFRCLFYLGMYLCCCCCCCWWCFSASVFGTSIISCLHGCSPPYSDCIHHANIHDHGDCRARFIQHTSSGKILPIANTITI